MSKQRIRIALIITSFGLLNLFLVGSLNTYDYTHNYLKENFSKLPEKQAILWERFTPILPFTFAFVTICNLLIAEGFLPREGNHFVEHDVPLFLKPPLKPATIFKLELFFLLCSAVCATLTFKEPLGTDEAYNNRIFERCKLFELTKLSTYAVIMIKGAYDSGVQYRLQKGGYSR